MLLHFNVFFHWRVIFLGREDDVVRPPSGRIMTGNSAEAVFNFTLLSFKDFCFIL